MRRGGDRERGRGRRAGCRRAHGAVVSVPEKISKRELGYVLFLRTNYPKVAFPTVPAKKKKGGCEGVRQPWKPFRAEILRRTEIPAAHRRACGLCSKRKGRHKKQEGRSRDCPSANSQGDPEGYDPLGTRGDLSKNESNVEGRIALHACAAVFSISRLVVWQPAKERPFIDQGITSCSRLKAIDGKLHPIVFCACRSSCVLRLAVSYRI